MTQADLEVVFDRDREVFGADRRAVLQMLYREAPGYAWVIERDGLDAYLLGRHGYEFEHLGPLVADDATTARQLVAACLAAHADRPFIMDVPLHASWVDWLELEGFAIQRPFVRMYRGEQNFREQLDRTFAIAGPEFG
jgi:hypothetical protein